MLVAMAALSCRYPNEFKNSPANAPHAVLGGTTYPKAGKIFATHINGQPTSFWRSSNVFRVPAGTNVVLAAYSDRKETLSYKAAEFVAETGREYVLVRKKEPSLASPLTAVPHPTTANAWIIYDQRDQVVIHQKVAAGPGMVVAAAPREAYAWGKASPEEALAEYRLKAQ
jgi:hypothetical protein